MATNEPKDVSVSMVSPEGSDLELEEWDDLEERELIKWLPMLINHLIIMVSVGVILALPIIVLVATGQVNFWLSFQNLMPRGSDEAKYITVRFFTWATSIVIVTVIISYTVSILPRVIIRITELITVSKVELVKQYLEFYTALTTTIKATTSITIAFILWCLYFPDTVKWNPNEDTSDWNVVLFRIMLCVFLATVIISIEKIILQLIAVRFHRTAYRQRLDDANYATFVLDRLNKARKMASNRKSKAQPRDSFIGTNYSDGTFNPLSKRVDINNQTIFGNINKRVFEGHYEKDIDPNSMNEARKLAKKIFYYLQAQNCNLLVEDFYPLFPTNEDAKKAFDYFDSDGNGDISRREMRDKITMVYKERKDLSLALRDTSQAVGKLDIIFLIIFLLFTAFICSLVFGKDLYATLIPFGTFFVGLSFIFGDSAKELFQSIIFLFVMHPYDAGDRVYIDKDNLLVHKVGLLGSQFTHVNGQVTYIPHTQLLKKIIYNIRRSTSQAEQIGNKNQIDSVLILIDFQIDYNTPKEKIVQLKERLNHYLITEESREFHSDILLALSEIVDSNQLKMFIWLEYKGNWQDGGRRWARKTRFMIALREICQGLDLSYSLLPQKIEHLNAPPYQPTESHH